MLYTPSAVGSVGHSPWTCSPGRFLSWWVAPRTFPPSGFCDTQTFFPFLCCYIRIDRALNSGITFSVSMVEECSKHQIFLCYKIFVLSLISLHNTSNKGQLSKSLFIFNFWRKSRGLRRQNATWSVVFATASKLYAIMQFIGFCFFM